MVKGFSTTQVLATAGITIPLSSEWNNAGTTFSGIQFNITDTASAAGSLLIDLQTNGISRFTVGKAGVVTVPTTGTFQFSTDTILLRDAANTLAQRNGTIAQTFRIYNTFTDASNYERVRISWSANAFSMHSEAAGSGAVRNVSIGAGTGGSILCEPNGRVTVGGNNGLQFGAQMLLVSESNLLRLINASQSTGAAFEIQEMTAPSAPATNRVRIYAEDDGSGKTRLMARFATGVAQQITIEP